MVGTAPRPAAVSRHGNLFWSNGFAANAIAMIRTGRRHDDRPPLAWYHVADLRAAMTRGGRLQSGVGVVAMVTAMGPGLLALLVLEPSGYAVDGVAASVTLSRRNASPTSVPRRRGHPHATARHCRRNISRTRPRHMPAGSSDCDPVWPDRGRLAGILLLAAASFNHLSAP